jgi:hypothetical protein
VIDEHVEVGSVVDQVELGSEAPAEKKREWFIRGMPSDLIEQVKTSAKAGRMTVGEWLTEKLRHILAQETGVLDDAERITKLEEEVKDAHQRIDGLCELLNAEREAKKPAERESSVDDGYASENTKLPSLQERYRERYRKLMQARAEDVAAILGRRVIK